MRKKELSGYRNPYRRKRRGKNNYWHVEFRTQGPSWDLRSPTKADSKQTARERIASKAIANDLRSSLYQLRLVEAFSFVLTKR